MIVPGSAVYRGRRVTFKYHRLLSGSGAHPPNSISALGEVLDGGAEAIEFDVRALADGFILLHDETLDQETDGSGSARARTSEEARTLRLRGWDESPALLDDAAADLRNAPRPLKVQVDLKEWRPLTADLSNRLLRALEPLRGNANLRVVVGCLGDWNLRSLRRLDPTLPVGLDFAFYLEVPVGETPRLPERVNAYGYLDDHPLGHVTAMPVADYLRDRIESLCHLVPGAVEVYLRKELILKALSDGVNPVMVVRQALGDVEVDAWTLNEADPNVQAELAALLDAGVNQITTDTAIQLAKMLSIDKL